MTHLVDASELSDELLLVLLLRDADRPFCSSGRAGGPAFAAADATAVGAEVAAAGSALAAAGSVLSWLKNPAKRLFLTLPAPPAELPPSVDWLIRPAGLGPFADADCCDIGCENVL